MTSEARWKRGSRLFFTLSPTRGEGQGEGTSGKSTVACGGGQRRGVTTPAVLALSALLAVATLGSGVGCIDEPAPPALSAVFIGAYPADVIFQPFAGSDATAVTRDPTTYFQGSASLKVTVPSAGDPDGTYAGGAFTGIDGGRNLTGYNALTFWAKASVPASLAAAGIGNDDTGTSLYMASVSTLTLTTDWQRYIIPIPLPSVMTNQGGYFFFSAAPQGQPLTGYELWFNTIQFETLSDSVLGPPQPAIETQALALEVGDPIEIAGAGVTYQINGAPESLDLQANYFTFSSSNTAVASFEGRPTTLATGAGAAVLTAALGTVPAVGAVNLEVTDVPRPALPPPEPTLLAANVISLLTSVYPNVPVDTFFASFSEAGQFFTVTLGADQVLKYEALNYAAIDFEVHVIDASAMTTLHLAVWTPDSTSILVKLVDFGADGIYSPTVDDSQGQITYDASSTPALVQGAWMNLEIPLSAFTATGLMADQHLAQLFVQGTTSTVYLDDLYFHN